jgi:hypothetical protein
MNPKLEPMVWPDPDDLDGYFGDSPLIAVFRGEAGPLPELRRWLDGPGLAVWLRENYCDLGAQLGPNLLRTVKEWKAGGPATESVVDKVLVRLGGQLVDLPGDLWIDRPKRRRREKQRDEKTWDLVGEAVR